jgi:hypothetical protein
LMWFYNNSLFLFGENSPLSGQSKSRPTLE